MTTIEMYHPGIDQTCLAVHDEQAAHLETLGWRRVAAPEVEAPVVYIDTADGPKPADEAAPTDTATPDETAAPAASRSRKDR